MYQGIRMSADALKFYIKINKGLSNHVPLPSHAMSVAFKSSTIILIPYLLLKKMLEDYCSKFNNC